MKVIPLKLLIFSLACTLLGIICPIIFSYNSNIDVGKSNEFSNSAFITTFILFIYGYWFYVNKNGTVSNNFSRILFAFIVCGELLIFSYCETPITITEFPHNAYLNNGSANARINNEISTNIKRNRNINFANNLRSRNGLNSKKIVFDKTFDSEGYVSFKLSAVENYKKTYNRSIIETNPVIYFTNDVVTSKEVDYAAWSNAPNVNPEYSYFKQTAS